MSLWPPALIEAVLDEAARGPARRRRQPLPPWETWYRRALEEGIEDELARLGRAVMREAEMQGFSDELRAECGWLDDGLGMLELAATEPDAAYQRWNELLGD